MAEEAIKTETQKERELRPLVRIIDADVEGSESTWLALTRVTGIDFMLSNAICTVLKLPKLEKVGYLTDEQLKQIEDCMQNPAKFNIPKWMLNRRRDLETGEDKHIVGAQVKLQQNMDIRFLRKIRSWRGIRHSRGLRVRGQRTRTTGRKGGTLGVIKKKVMAPKGAPKKEGKKK